MEIRSSLIVRADQAVKEVNIYKLNWRKKKARNTAKIN